MERGRFLYFLTSIFLPKLRPPGVEEGKDLEQLVKNVAEEIADLFASLLFSLRFWSTLASLREVVGLAPTTLIL